MLLTGVIYMMLAPVGHIPDVWEHVYRVSSILNGDIIARHVDSVSAFHNSTENVGGAVSWDLINLSIEYDDGYDPGVVFPDTINASNAHTADVPFNNTATNTPIVYLPQLIIFALAGGLPAVAQYWLAQLFMLLVYSVALGISVRAIPKHKLLFAAVALFPPLVFRYSFAISADSMTQASVMVFIAFVFRVLYSREVTKLSLAGMLVSGFILCLSKFVYAPLIALVIVVVLIRRRNMSVVAVCTSIISSIGFGLVTFAWVSANRWYVTTPGIVSSAEVQSKTHALLENPNDVIGNIVFP